jgi:hypothetical protein
VQQLHCSCTAAYIKNAYDRLKKNESYSSDFEVDMEVIVQNLERVRCNGGYY